MLFHQKVAFCLFIIMIPFFYPREHCVSMTNRIKTLPVFKTLRRELPQPVYDADSVWIDLYWKSWEPAFQNFYQPTEKNGFASNFIDAAFNENIFLWDTCFMAMFCNYGYRLLPGIESLDNFYAKRIGCKRFCFNDNLIDLVAGEVHNNQRKIDIRTENAFTLFIHWKNKSGRIIVSPGESSLMLDYAPF